MRKCSLHAEMTLTCQESEILVVLGASKLSLRYGVLISSIYYAKRVGANTSANTESVSF